MIRMWRFGLTDKDDLIGKSMYDNPVIPRELLERLGNNEDINLHLNYDFSNRTVIIKHISEKVSRISTLRENAYLICKERSIIICL